MTSGHMLVKARRRHLFVSLYFCSPFFPERAKGKIERAQDTLEMSKKQLYVNIFFPSQDPPSLFVIALVYVSI